MKYDRFTHVHTKTTYMWSAFHMRRRSRFIAVQHTQRVEHICLQLIRTTHLLCALAYKLIIHRCRRRRRCRRSLSRRFIAINFPPISSGGALHTHDARTRIEHNFYTTAATRKTWWVWAEACEFHPLSTLTARPPPVTHSSSTHVALKLSRNKTYVQKQMKK